MQDTLYFLINIIIFILQVLMLIKSIKRLKKNILDFSSIFYIIYFIFYVPVFFDLFYNLNLLGYTYKIVSEYKIDVTKNVMIYFNFISFLIMLFFCTGYNSYNTKNKKKLFATYDLNSKRYLFVQLFLFFVWLILTLKTYLLYGKSIFMYFTPATKSIYSSFYEKYTILVVPYIMYILRCARDLSKFGKIKSSSLVYAVIMLLTSMASGQRREMLSVVLFCALTYIFFNQRNKDIKKEEKNLDLQNNTGTISKKKRRKIITLAVASLLLIAFTWYGRVYFTQIQKGKTHVVNPMKVRGVTEVIYGSSSTGFPTTLILYSYYKNSGLPYLRQVKFLATSFIPSSLYKNKSKSFTEELQINTNSDSNLSLFFINDLYFTFGLFSLIVSFFVGRVLSIIYSDSFNSTAYNKKYLSFLIFSQIILLYKNGLTEFIIRLIFVYFFINFFLKFVFSRREKND